MAITVRKYTPADLTAAVEIWNEVVRDGVAFPQTEPLTEMTGAEFFAAQSHTGVAFNTHARHLYERLGFTQLGTIPGGFRLDDGTYADICPYYKTLD